MRGNDVAQRALLVPVLAEHEVLDRLHTEFGAAARDCELLARLPARGPTYNRFRHTLRVIEGHCRVMGFYREDARWLPLGIAMAEAHKRAGNWLRTHPRTENSNLAHPLFLWLAENLRAGAKACERLQTKATGRRGMILPKTRSEVRTAGRPMQVKLPAKPACPQDTAYAISPSGLIVPREYAA